MVVRVLLCLVFVYVTLAAIVYFGQRHLQYSPSLLPPGTPAENHLPEMKEVRVKTKDDLDLLAWFVPPKNKDGKVLVFFHGNAGHMGERAHKIRHFIDAGYGVYLCEYRGFGGNPGTLSEEGIYNDARAGLEWLKTQGYKPSQWIAYGESIGSGPAVQMTQEYAIPSLILEGAFSSAVAVAQGRYFWLPVNLLMKDKFDNISKIASLKTSLLMLHGDKDLTVPYSIGKKLYEAAKQPKKLITIEGGHHSDLYDYHADKMILSWLKEQQ